MRDIALSVVIFGLLPFCFSRPWVGILTWQWVGLMNPHRLAFGFAYSFPYAMLVAGATLLGLLFSRERKPVPWNRELVLMLALFGYFGFTSVFAWVPDAAWNRWLDFGKVILMAIAGTTVIYGKNRIRWLIIVIALSIGFYGIKGGIWVFLTGGGERVQGPDDSFISGNTFIGLALTMVLPLLVTLGRDEARQWRRRFFFASAMLSTVAAIFTYSRGALIGLAVVLPLLFLRARSKFLVVLLVIPTAIIFMQLAPEKLFMRADTIAEYQTDESAMQRIQSWNVAFNIARESPLTGAGFNLEDYPDARRWLSYANPDLIVFLDHPAAAHSIYFQIMGQHGFGGLGLYLLLFFSTLFSLQKLTRETTGVPELRWIGNYASNIQIGLVGYMVSGAFLSSGYFDLAYLYVTFTAILSRELSEYRGATQTGTAQGNRLRPQLQHPPQLGGQIPLEKTVRAATRRDPGA